MIPIYRQHAIKRMFERNIKAADVVFADNLDEGERLIITVYEPNPVQWSPDFTKRIKP